MLRFGIVKRSAALVSLGKEEWSIGEVLLCYGDRLRKVVTV